MNAVWQKNLVPEFELSSLDEVTGLVLVHLVLVGDLDKFIVAEPLGVGDVSEVRVALLAILSNDERFVDLRMISCLSEMLQASTNETIKLTLFSFRKASGLLFESIAILATAL